MTHDRAGDGWLALTSAQAGLWFAHQLDPTNPSLTTAEVVEFAGPVDQERLARSLTRAYLEFEQTRAVFRSSPEGPRQRVSPEPLTTLVVVEVDSPADARAWMEQNLARPMDLESGDTVRAALLRLPPGPDGTLRSWWFHAAHHVVLDGYGAQQLLRRVTDLYSDPETPGLQAPSLAQLVAEDVADSASTAHRDAVERWEKVLGTCTGPASLAGRTASPAAAATRGQLEIDDVTQKAITSGARRLGIAWPDLLAAAVATYVGRMTSGSTIRVGVPLMNRTVPGRPTPASAHTVCTAMNVVPIRVPVSGTVASCLDEVVAEQNRVRQHPRVRQEFLTRELARTAAGAQLFGAQVNVIPFDLELRLEDGQGQARGIIRNLVAGPVEDMTVGFRGNPGRGRGFRLELDVNPQLYPADEVDWHLHRIAAWVRTVAEADPAHRIDGLPLLPERERRTVLEEFNATEHPREVRTLGERFTAQAALTPDAVALVAADGCRTYAELLDAARRVATGLAAEGVRRGDVVGVRLERGTTLLEVIHGVVLLGAVYLPLDPDLPSARIEAMVHDAAAVRVVDADSVPAGDPPATSLPGAALDDPAYLLFTSGSTGRPKGVVVGHRAIDNRIAWQQHHLPIGAGDRVLHKTPISFDVSVWELFWALQTGATLVVAAPGAHRDPRALATLMVAEEVDVLHFVPSMLRAFVQDPEARAAVRAGRVRHVVTSGEALTPDLVAECVEWFGVAPTNLYGPTEAAVDVTVWDSAVTDEVVPIGRPVWNTRCYVLDPDLRPSPLGVPGELWLAGIQLAEGYVGAAELTRERFVPDPFVRGEARDGATPVPRMYRTGDLAAWRADGALRYLGRTDDQVKIRGQRVELGEIEAAVSGTDGVAAVAAGTVDDDQGQRLVVWFAVSEAAGVDAVESRLREAASRKLPAGWLPHHWVAVPTIPLGSSGKADRRRLVAEHPPGRSGTAVQTAPRGLSEQRWCELFARILGLDRVGPDDDFFALGGDSLRVLRLMASAQEEWGIRLQLADVFAHPTAAALAGLDPAGTADETREVLTLRHASGGAARAHLFMLPPAGGLGWCYTHLLRHLPQDVAVHTIQAPGLDQGAPEPVRDLSGLATRQLAAIRTVVGTAPFHLAGWSLGGMAAHELAALATEQGQRVESVLLLDAYPSEQWQHLPTPTESDALVGVLRLGGVESPELDRESPELDRESVVEMLRVSGSALATLPRRTISGCVASVVEAARLVRGARHTPLEGDLTVVVAGAPRSESWLDAEGWTRHTRGDVRIVTLDARHEQLIRPPFAEAVGLLLAERLESSAPIVDGQGTGDAWTVRR